MTFAGIWNRRGTSGPPGESLSFQNGPPCSLSSFSEESPGAAGSNLKPSQQFMTKTLEETGSERGKGEPPIELES